MSAEDNTMSIACRIKREMDKRLKKTKTFTGVFSENQLDSL